MGKKYYKFVYIPDRKYDSGYENPIELLESQGEYEEFMDKHDYIEGKLTESELQDYIYNSQAMSFIMDETEFGIYEDYMYQYGCLDADEFNAKEENNANKRPGTEYIEEVTEAQYNERKSYINKLLAKVDSLKNSNSSGSLTNLSKIKSAVQDKKEDYIVFLFQTDVHWLMSEYYDLDSLYKDLITKNYTARIQPGQTIFDRAKEDSDIDNHFCSQIGYQTYEKLIESGDPNAIEKYIKKLILLIKVAHKSNWKFENYVVGGYGHGMKYWIPQDEDQLNTFIDLFMDLFLTGVRKKQQITESVRSDVMQYLKTKDRSILDKYEYDDRTSQDECDGNPCIDLNNQMFL